MNVRWLVAPLVAMLLVLVVSSGSVAACGGFFCGPVPVDQAAERIIFTMDGGTITTYVQINYVGRAEDFAWVLPMPNVPKVDTAEMSMFRDLDRLTQPVYIGPRPPDCLRSPRSFGRPSRPTFRRCWFPDRSTAERRWPTQSRWRRGCVTRGRW